MAINYKSVNYGLPSRYTKLPMRKVSTKERIYSRCMVKGVELFNPEPMPYQKDSFKPCTVSRIVDIPRRMNDGFMVTDDMSAPRQRGIILHKDRYDWSSVKDTLSNQTERLAAEENYIKKAKALKKLTEHKLKTSMFNLLLEGENMLPVMSQEKIESKKDRSSHFMEEDSFRHTAPTMITNYCASDDVLDTLDLQQPVSMDVHQIKLKIRQFGGESISSAPVQSNSNHMNMDNMQNMYVPPDGRDSFNRFPPINNKQKEFEQNLFSSMSSHTDYDSAFRQSERFNRPNIRLNEYAIDGVPVKFIERADIQGELKCLKSLALPTTARDLFIGRGIHLPSNHATKNPRGRYIDDNSNAYSQMTGTIKIETHGGGSVTINTKISPNKSFVPDNTPTITDPIVDARDGQNNTLELEEDLSAKEIFESLIPNDEGFVDSVKFIEYLNDLESLSKDEKIFIAAPLQSMNGITVGQVAVFLNTVKIIIELDQSFRDNLITFDNNKMKNLFPNLMISLDQSRSPINATDFYEFLITSLNLSLTMENCAEIYTTFQDNLKSSEKFNKDILQSHILLFIPFLLQIIENE